MFHTKSKYKYIVFRNKRSRCNTFIFNDISDQMVINRKRVSPVLLMQSRKICLTELSEMETENNTPPDNH